MLRFPSIKKPHKFRSSIFIRTYRGKKKCSWNRSSNMFIISNINFMIRGRGTSLFPVKHEKFPPSYIRDAKNFSVVKSLNSGEARASPASPVPRPLAFIQICAKFGPLFATLVNFYLLILISTLAVTTWDYSIILVFAALVESR